LVRWFRGWFRRARSRHVPRVGAVEELLDPYHPRASMIDGDRIAMNPGKVLENIQLAMERLDLDISTPISIEEDVVPLDELLNLVEVLGMGVSIHVHVVNSAMSIMSRRYPAELVTGPLPPEFDLRALTPIVITEDLHDTAKLIFNMRTVRTDDLIEGDVSGLLADLDGADQATTFTALFYMYGLKIGAMKNVTGIE